RLLDTQVDRVIKSGSSRDDRVLESIRDQIDVAGVVLEQLNLIVKAHQKDFILRVACLDKGESGPVHHLDLVPHASTDVQRNPHADRDVLLGKKRNVLRDSVLE